MLAQIEAVTQAASLLLGPLVTGYVLSMVYTTLRGERIVGIISYQTLTSNWVLGFICLTLTSALTAVTLPPYAIAASAVLIVISVGLCVVLGDRALTPLMELAPKSAILSSVLIIGAVVPFWYLRRLAPFPLTLGADMFTSLGNLAGISSGIRGVFLNDDGFLVLIGSSSLVSGGTPLLGFWTGPFVQYLVMELGVYVLSYRVLKNEILSLAAAMIPLWFMNDGVFNDLFYLLRPNLLMALSPLLLILVLFANPIHGSRSSRLSFLLAGAIPVFYFFDLTPGLYINTLSQLPKILQLAFQPGIVLTLPAYAFNTPQAGFQGLYALTLSVAMLLIVLFVTPPGGRKAVIVWAGVTFMAMTIEYRMGFFFGMLLWALLLIDSRGGSRIYAIAGSLGLVFPTIELSGLSSNLRFNSVLSAAFGKIAQLPPAGSTSPSALVDLFRNSYGSFYYYLAFFAMLVLVLLAWRTSKELRPLGVAMGVCLALFFSPLPSSYSLRFLFVLTPLIVVLSFAAIQVVSQTIELLVDSSRPNQSGKQAWSRHLRHVILGPKARNVKILKSVVLALVILVAAANLTGSYDTFSRTFAVYAQTGYVSTFSPQDLQMANWMRANLSSNTIVVSDPETLAILTALSSMPYTVLARTYLTPTVTSPIVTANPELFEQTMVEFWLPSLNQLWELYNESSASMGIAPPANDVLVVVNNRTTAWVNGWSYPGWGPSSYYLSPNFTPFGGLGLLIQSGLVSPIRITSSYWAYLLKVPAHQSTVGPAISVYVEGGKESINTLEESYEPSEHYYLVNLTGSKTFLVSDVPSQWTYVGAIGNSTETSVIEKNETTFLVYMANPNSQIQLRWFS